MTQLDAALLALRDRLEAALQAFAPQPARHVAISLPFAADGSPAPDTGGRTLLALAGVRMDAVRRNLPPVRAGEPAGPGAWLEADVLVTVNDPDLPRAAGKLAAIVAALEHEPVLAAEAGPVVAAFFNLSYEEASRVVGLAGIRGMPFVLYQLRGIAVGG